MSSSPKTGHRNEPRGDRSDRVQRACDRCNNSRTRCSGELPWYGLELNYACQYERAVKKRSPKPRSAQQACHSGKSCLKTMDRERAYHLPDSPSSGDSRSHDNKPSLCMPSDWDADGTDSQSPDSISDIYSSLYMPNPVPYSDKELFSVQEAHIPGYNHFSLDLSPLDIASDNNTPTYRYPCLSPILPLLKGTMAPEDACNLLDIFFADPEMTSPDGSCPYVLSPVIRRKSLLQQINPRPVSPALLAIILWCVLYTANLEIFQEPSARARATQCLYFLSMKLLCARDSDNWHRSKGGWVSESDMPLYATTVDSDPCPPSDERPAQNVDDVLSYVLLTCVVSGTEFRDECIKWWNKAVLLQMFLSVREDHEERRRAFWLVYSLDRHLALTLNEPLYIHDSECQVLYPLPEWIWQNLDSIPLEDIPPRLCGPPTQIFGTGFFEYFLPLMAILGDIIELRSRSQHPRLGGFDETYLTGTIETMLSECEYSLGVLRAVRAPLDSQYLIWVLHMLLYWKWDTLSILEDNRSCVLSPDLFTCTANSITVGESIAGILDIDKRLSFTPFVFGVYLFHGSLNFLSVADQMVQLGASDLAKQGCEAIVRANEVAIKTLDTSFQRDFTRIVRQYGCRVGMGTGSLRGQDCSIAEMKAEFNDGINY
ncbi:hypothetical protein BDW62DRAFT_213137 [Aspergillus aurantiobrunneus]